MEDSKGLGLTAIPEELSQLGKYVQNLPLPLIRKLFTGKPVSYSGDRKPYHANFKIPETLLTTK